MPHTHPYRQIVSCPTVTGKSPTWYPRNTNRSTYLSYRLAFRAFFILITTSRRTFSPQLFIRRLQLVCQKSTLDLSRQTSVETSRTMRSFQFATRTKCRESTTASINSSSVSRNKKKSSKPSLKEALRQLRGPRSRHHQSSVSSFETDSTESEVPATVNVMEFLIDVCPEDILPKILAFAGPQKTAALSKVNRVWRNVIAEEWTWRVLCEDLNKVCFLDILALSPYFQILSWILAQPL
jgi:hypothetical protein